MSVRAVGNSFRVEQRLLAPPRLLPEHSDNPAPENAAERSALPLAAPEDASDVTRRHYRPAAPFVAHVIATFQGAPQTRNRARASGFEAATAYRNVQRTVGAT